MISLQHIRNAIADNNALTKTREGMYPTCSEGRHNPPKLLLRRNLFINEQSFDQTATRPLHTRQVD
jgi:hypothetical protein